MRKLFIILGLTAITALPGCGKDARNDIYEESGRSINVNNNRTELYNESPTRGIRNHSSDYGYVREQKSPVLNDRDNAYYAAVNREQLANIISKFGVRIPNVRDVATLVTDQEVLIGYRTTANNKNLAADQVKKTAMSIVPGYYHVYVTDDTHLIREIEALSHMDSRNKNARRTVNSVIKQMQKSPQGTPMNASENANGMTPDDHVTRPHQ